MSEQEESVVQILGSAGETAADEPVSQTPNAETNGTTIPLISVEDEENHLPTPTLSASKQHHSAWTTIGEAEEPAASPPDKPNGTPLRLKDRMLANIKRVNSSGTPLEGAIVGDDRSTEATSPFHAPGAVGGMSWDVLLNQTGIAQEENNTNGWAKLRTKKKTAVNKARWTVERKSAAEMRHNWDNRRLSVNSIDVKSFTWEWPDPDRYCPRSLYMFTLTNKFRRFCISGIEWRWWDRIVLSLILLNTIQLAMYDPFDTPESRPGSPRRLALEYLSMAFSGIFALEAFVKIVALGLIFGNKAYLTEAWNRLDLFIVVVGILDLLPIESTNLSTLRALRVMRPLRAINRFPQLRFLVTLLLQCLPMLSNVLALCCFIFFVFGILAVQLVQGRLRGTCYDLESGQREDVLCTLKWGKVPCPHTHECLLLADNPGEGVINFDSIGGAIVVIFQIMTLEGWTDIMYMVQDVFWDGSWFYFIVLVFLGPIFAIQLFLVVITSKFADVRESMRRMEAKTAALLPDTSSAASPTEGSAVGLDLGLSSPTVSPNRSPRSRSPRSRSPRSRSPRRGNEQQARVTSQRGVASKKMESPLGPAPDSPSLPVRSAAADLSIEPFRGEGDGVDPNLDELDQGLPSSSFRVPAALDDEASDEVLSFHEGSLEGSPAPPPKTGNGNGNGNGSISVSENGNGSVGAGANGVTVAEGTAEEPKEGEKQLAEGGEEAKKKKAAAGGGEAKEKGDGGAGEDSLNGQATKPLRQWRTVQARLNRLVKNDVFINFVLVVIVVNTVSMAIDHECDRCAQAYCRRFKGSLEAANLFFAAVFLIEMLLKLVGLGLQEYVKSRANIFDAVIVILSLAETPNNVVNYNCYMLTRPCADYNLCDAGLGGLTVLRTFRLLRVVKLLRAFPDVQKQIRILVSVMSSVAALIVLIILFLLIFCILGMNIFGASIMDDPDLVYNGSSVFVRLPWERDGEVRYGTVIEMDHFNYPNTPWRVAVRFGTETRVQEVIPLPPGGSFWAGVGDEAGLGVPSIIGVSPRMNFDDLPHAVVSTFEVLTMSNWNEQLYIGVKSQGALSGVYFYALIAIGTWMLLNLFIAILIQGFAEQKAIKYRQNMKHMQQTLVHHIVHESKDEREIAQRIEELFEAFDSNLDGEIDIYELNDGMQKLKILLRPKELSDILRNYDTNGSGTVEFDEWVSMLLDMKRELAKEEAAGAGKGKLKTAHKARKGASEGSGLQDQQVIERLQLQKKAAGMKTEAQGQHALDNHLRTEAVTIRKQKTGKNVLAKEASVAAASSPLAGHRGNGGSPLARVSGNEAEPGCCWGHCDRQGRWRAFCQGVVASKPFDRSILACIAVSSVGLAIDRPNIGNGSPERIVLNVTELVLNAVFLFEAIFKIGAMHFVPYIRSGWNKLDFFIVCTSVLDSVLSASLSPDFYSSNGQNMALGALKILRIFRIFRALRPLRVIARAKGLRVLVTTLLSAVKPVINTVSIAFCIFSVLGILGMQLLSGRLNACSDRTVWYKESCVGFDVDGSQRQWLPHIVNFDHFGKAVRALFILATLDNWTAHMWAGVDSTGRDTGPTENNQPEMILYFFMCVIIAGFLVINIFVGVFVDCYTAASSDGVMQRKEKLDPSKLPDVWDDPTSPRRVYIYRVLEEQAFDLFIAIFIIANVVTMAMESWKQSTWQSGFIDTSNFFFTMIFGIECTVKMYALHPRRYFAENWNRFDFFIVMISYMGILVDSIGEAVVGVNPTVLRILRVFRVFRILRAFRIFKAAKGLHSIITTLVRSLPAIINLFAMLFLLFFIYGVLGVTLYGEVCVEGQQRYDGLKGVRCLFTKDDELLDIHANFLNVGLAVLTLFRVATGDAWGDILTSCSLAAATRQVTEGSWNDLTRLLEAEGRTPESAGLSRDAKDAALDIAAEAIRQWNASVFGGEGDPSWPFPGTGSIAGGDITEKMAESPAFQWIQLGRSVLPGCLTDSESYTLEQRGLMDCTTSDGYERQCTSTCGDPILANIYYMSFLCMSAFVLLQLVIAVLMEQLEQTSSANQSSPESEYMPGSSVLSKRVFSRMYRRWRWYSGIRDQGLNAILNAAAAAKQQAQAASVDSMASGSRRKSRKSSSVQGGRGSNGNKIHHDAGVAESKAEEGARAAEGEGVGVRGYQATGAENAIGGRVRRRNSEGEMSRVSSLASAGNKPEDADLDVEELAGDPSPGQQVSSDATMNSEPSGAQFSSSARLAPAFVSAKKTLPSPAPHKRSLW